MTKKALLIEWDPSTGEREGGINPRDPKLHCSGWQNMDCNPAIELRLVKDDRDLSIYNSVAGVTVIIGTDDINAAITANFPPKVYIEDELIYTEHVKNKISKKEIDIETLSDSRNERLKELKGKGIKGIKEINPTMV